ncbi:MAG: hypothetical protein ACREJC_09260 [Tepidisphaeraceae bacterium]
MTDHLRHPARVIGVPVLITAVAIVMYLWTRDRWADPVVDFGRELYLPWQVSAGRVLYRDLPHYNGPLSQYCNAAVFSLFGASLRTLQALNLIWIAVLTAAAYRVFFVIGERLSVVVAIILMLTLFVFTQLRSEGSFNFVCPYSHELTHGVTLAFLCLAVLFKYLETHRLIWLITTGALLGLVALTKVEVLAATAPAILAGIVIDLWVSRASLRSALKILIVLFVAAIAPPVVTIAMLSLAMPLDQAFLGVVGAWQWAFDPGVWGMHFYERLAGTHLPGGSLDRAIACALVYAIVLAPGVLAGMIVRGGREARIVTAIGATVGVAAMLHVFYQALDWQYALSGLGLFVAAVLVSQILHAAHSPRARIDARQIMRIVVCAFSLLLLAKVALNVTISGYGFALAMPATMLAATAMVSWIPQWVARGRGDPLAPRATALLVLGVALLYHLRAYQRSFPLRPVRVGEGPNVTWCDLNGLSFNEMLGILRSQAPAGATLAVLPEGAMINFLTQRINPTGFVSLKPTDVAMFGSDRILRAFQTNPPDYIVTIPSNTEMYGVKSFASDYGRVIWRWIARNYEPIANTTTQKDSHWTLYRHVTER